MGALEMAMFAGCIPALITPFTADGSAVNVAVVSDLVKHHLGAGVGGFYLCGNTGEGFVCTVDERKAMVEAVMDAMRAHQSDKPILVHGGACPVEEAMALAVHSKEAGAHGVSSVVPLDAPNNVAAAAKYFTAVAGATDLPFYAYWVATDADMSVDARQYLEAMKDVPNFKGIKFTDKNFYMFQQLMYLAPSILGHRLNAVTGPDEMAVAGLAMGADGAIGSTYNVQPKLNCAMHAAFKAGQVEEATKMQEQLNATIAKLINACDCNTRGTNIIAGLKAVYRARGFDVGPAREGAATALSAEAEKDLLDTLAGYSWKVE